MQFFGLLIPIIIGYFLDEMATGVIIGSLFWLVAWSIAKQRQEERLAESATAGDRMQKLEQEIELLKQRLSVLEHEAVRDEAKVGQGLEARAVADVQTASEPLQVRVEPGAEAASCVGNVSDGFVPAITGDDGKPCLFYFKENPVHYKPFIKALEDIRMNRLETLFDF